MRRNVFMIASVATVLLFFMFSSCKTNTNSESFGNPENPFFGKVYGEVEDIPEFAQWQWLGGRIVGTDKTEDGNYRFALSFFEDEAKNIICVFEELIRNGEDETIKNKILDTINIGKENENEYFSCCSCRQGQESCESSEIFAIVVNEMDKEFFNILRAWRADTKTGTIKPVEELQGLECINEGY